MNMVSVISVCGIFLLVAMVSVYVYVRVSHPVMIRSFQAKFCISDKSFLVKHNKNNIHKDNDMNSGS